MARFASDWVEYLLDEVSTSEGGLLLVNDEVVHCCMCGDLMVDFDNCSNENCEGHKNEQHDQ